MTTKHKIFTMSFARVYACLVAKAERKERKRAEVDAIICWLTGYKPRQLREQIEKGADYETFFTEAPRLNPGVFAVSEWRRSKSRPCVRYDIWTS